MIKFAISPLEGVKNQGIAREWALCNYFGVPRTKHDSVPFNKGSDLIAQGMKISIKASDFTLMAGNLCHGYTDFDDIWNVFETESHSDTFAYITNNYDVFLMNMDEFKTLVYTFCTIAKESSKNGGKTKIRCRKESAKMREWLERALAA